MKFRTEITIKKDASKTLSPKRPVLLAGSCFSDNIGAMMQRAGWPASANPCGVIYNPVSMALLFRLALAMPAIRREIVASALTSREDKWASWFMGKRAVADTAEQCADLACEAIDTLQQGIEQADAIILTFGTSDVWLLAGTDRAVGNCHKHPAAEFDRRRVSVEEIVEVWKEIIAAVRERNPEVKFILTVSPRRYLSEGFAENTRQKAVLILACERLCREVENTDYFPAYEILNDDLRDYRFYSADLLHPSEQAVEYIWEKFTEAYLSEADTVLLRSMEKEARRSRHIPIQKS